MKLFLRPEGVMTSPFANSDSYRKEPHTGIDYVLGFKRPRLAMADGFIYKIVGKGNPDPQVYRNIHQICETPIGPMEVAYVHCWDIFCEEGDEVLQAQPIYTEGNTGTEVFVNGIRVKPEEKASGKGSHAHNAVRPVEKVKTLVKGEYYLEKNGRKYKDSNKNYYRVLYKDNGAKGWIDFSQYLFTPTKDQLRSQYQKVLGYLQIAKDNLK